MKANPDFGLAAGDYARHRVGFPDSLFERLRAFGVGVPGQTVVDLGTGTGERRFRDLQSFSYDVDVPNSHEAWRGRSRASAGVGASLSPEKVAVFDAELATLLRERYPQDPLAIPHRVFAIVGSK